MSIPRSELPLELTAEVTTADGTRFQWGANRPPGERFQGLNFSTAIGEGFSKGSVRFSRRFDLDYPDLGLVDTITFVGADGSVAYEGRNSAMPRELTDTHNIGVTLAGWMAHGTDRKFQEIYVDRDLSAWGEMPLARRNVHLGVNHMPGSVMQGHDPGDTSVGTVTLGFSDTWVSPYTPVSEAWYDANPSRIARITANFARSGGTGSAAPWDWQMYLTDNDDLVTGGGDASGSLVGPGPSGWSVAATAGTRRYGVLFFTYTGTPAGIAGAQFNLDWSRIAVYGNHGIPTYIGDPNEPAGVRAGDVIRNIVTRFCPKLQLGEIAVPDYVIQHLAFKEQTDPYEAMKQANKYHLYNLAVWEDKKVYWRPFELEDYDWQVRAGEDAQVTLQGPSTENVFNGIVVSYNDLLTGIKNVLDPSTNPELRDTNPANPWNRHGVDRWDQYELTYPHLKADALQAGRAALADRNRAKSPGNITATGYVRDRSGNQQPGWKVRAGDTVAIVNHPNDAPRLIHETSWDDDSKVLTMSVDAPPSLLDAQQDRVMTALQARGLL